MGGSTGSGPVLSLGEGAGGARRRVVGFELVRLELELSSPWASGAGAFGRRDSFLVRAVMEEERWDGKVVAEGWGECAALPAPTFSGEYTAGELEVAERYLVPAALRSGGGSASELPRALAGTKGHGFAKAALEAGVLDAELRLGGVGMADHFLARSASSDERRRAVPGGVAVGLAASVGALLDEVGARVHEGYRRVKLKIRPGWDVVPLRAVRERWPDLLLLADANGAYSSMGPEAAAACLAPAADLALSCLEQPLGDDDLLGHARLAGLLAVPLCLDEALSSTAVLEAALALGACEVANIKPGRLGGYGQAVAAHDICRRHGAGAWVGGMVETGVARAANVALASLPGFTLPGDVSASGRFFDPDIVEPSFGLDADGAIAVPAGPGSGVEVRADVVAACSTWRKWFPSS